MRLIPVSISEVSNAMLKGFDAISFGIWMMYLYLICGPAAMALAYTFVRAQMIENKAAKMYGAKKLGFFDDPLAKEGKINEN